MLLARLLPHVPDGWLPAPALSLGLRLIHPPAAALYYLAWAAASTARSPRSGVRAGGPGRRRATRRGRHAHASRRHPHRPVLPRGGARRVRPPLAVCGAAVGAWRAAAWLVGAGKSVAGGVSQR
ncbi:hypothetical protein Psuf_080470 [Phytohabitans suffuscus]|uniref:Uncharacterized protein n=1 Tax=Phytohabitans suffuscus TaxID=624315 RepID=A0A6F8YXF8_9ACTN|nr:hypothetical protein Psuf_080470 [Phytohabitans suffuscus]